MAKYRLLTILIGLLFAQIAFADGSESFGGYQWSYWAENYIPVSGGVAIGKLVGISPDPSGSVQVPSSLGGYPVAVMNHQAFSGYDKMTAVTIPASVKEIGQESFCGCSRLKTVTFLGDCPEVPNVESSATEDVGRVFHDTPNDLTIYVYADTTGWPSGSKWFGKKLVKRSRTPTIVESVVTVAVNPESDRLRLSLYESDLAMESRQGLVYQLDELVEVASGSACTMTVSGLPSGVTYNKKTNVISGTPRTKGICYVTYSAKNANGYSHSCIQRWTVGDADNGDYDDIGVGDYGYDLTAFENLQVGVQFDGWGSYITSVTGLPPGLTFSKGKSCSSSPMPGCGWNSVGGTPTKAGKCVIRFTAGGKKAQKTVIVRDGYSGYLSVQPGLGYDGRGTVTGGGVKHAGTTVKLTARPKSGYYFAGWYSDEDCTQEFADGKSGDYRTASESFAFDGESKSLYAKFVSKGEDSDISISADETWNVETEYGSDYLWFEVESVTAPKVTAKGLPTGVKLSGMELVISDTSKLKPGTSLVTLTAKNLSGATATKTIRIVVPNLQSGVFDGIEYDGVACSFTVGESGVCTAPWGFSVAEGWTVTASGLPAGIKFNFDKDDGYAWLSGMATKAGVYTVTLTAKKGRQTEKATFTVEVAPFPTDAIGTYGGVIGSSLEDDESDEYAEVGYCIGNVDGTFSATVAKGGKISVKFMAGGKTVSLSGYSCAVTEEAIEVYFADAKDNWCNLTLSPQNGLGSHQVSGSFGTSDSEWSVLGQRNVAKSDAQMKAMVAKLSKLGKIQGVVSGGNIICPMCLLFDAGTPVVTFSVGSDGMVKSAGKIEGRSVSGSAILQVLKTEDDYLLYADFYDYKASGGSSRGKLTYRAVFSWGWLSDTETQISAKNALYAGSYYADWRSSVACKPVIYLYPETETECSVKVNLDGKLTCTYPDYGLNGWSDFVAAPDGTLTFAGGAQYYCLYWEGQMNAKWDFSEGYCVKGSETASFLADILPRMGLTFREANEFIIYWLPLMQDNPYNVISFQGENYTKSAQLQIVPQPDSILRVFMAWKPSSRAVDISAPVVAPFVRTGFTVVEWGGTKCTE